MTAIAIRKDVPLPPPRGGAAPSKSARYPWREMEVGDSFVVPLPDAKTGTDHLTSISSQAGAAAKRIGDVRYACRKLEDGAVGVWRVK